MKLSVPNINIIMMFSGLSLLLLSAVMASPKGSFVLVLTNPFLGEIGGMDVIGKAGGSFVSGSQIGWINIAHSDETDFISNLRQSGAWLVANHKLAFGCVR